MKRGILSILTAALILALLAVLPVRGAAAGVLTHRVSIAWDDAGFAYSRPDSLDVIITGNGVHVQTVTLSADSGWSCTWAGQDDGSLWQVSLAAVPEGYTASISQCGTSFLITNIRTSPASFDHPPTMDAHRLFLWGPVLLLSGGAAVLTLAGCGKRQR